MPTFTIAGNVYEHFDSLLTGRTRLSVGNVAVKS